MISNDHQLGAIFEKLLFQSRNSVLIHLSGEKKFRE